jgi:hypothetical protein
MLLPLFGYLKAEFCKSENRATKPSEVPQFFFLTGVGQSYVLG